MSKLDDIPKWEDGVDIDEIPKWEDGEDIEDIYQEPEKMGALEAAVTGAGQGASFGLSPIVAGMTGAASEVAEDLPVQSDLSSVIGGGLVPEVADLIPKDVDTQLQEQGFKIKDEYEGLEGLMQAYYDQRDRQRAQEAKAFEDQPLATLGGGVVGGIASSIAAAPLAAESKLAGAILPKAQTLKGATWGQKAAVAAREGAKAGSLAGFGSGEAKLGEGEVLGTLEETAKTGVGGAIMGGGLSSLGSLAGGITKLAQKPLSLPKMGFKAAYKEGLDVLNPDQVRDHIKKSSKEVISIIKKNFNVTGESKRELLEQADELGKRVALGDDINEIVNDIMTDEAWNKQSQKELSGFIEDLYRLDVSRNLDQEKLVAKSQEQLAKMINKESLKGAELIKSGTGIEAIDDLVPKGPEGIVASAEAKLKFPPKNQWSKPKYKDIITQSSKQDEIVPIAQFDFDSMSLTEADKFKRFVGAMAFPKGEKQEASYLPYAKDLYSRVKEKINTEIQNSSLSDQNKTLHSLYNALESIGIKSKDFFSKDEVTQRKVVNQLVSKMKSSALSEGDLQMDDFIHFLSKVDDNIGTTLKEKSNFATQLSEIISTTSSSVSPKILLGPFQQVAAKAGNIVGFGARGAVDFKNQAFKLVKDSSPERVQQLGSELYEAFGEKAVPYINQLGKITNLPERSKNALMFSMFQQPAFRQMLYDLGSNVVGSGVEAKERDNYVERIDSSIDDDIISSEPEKKSKEPQSESPSTSKKVVQKYDILDYVTSDEIEGGFQKQSKDTGNYIGKKLIGTNYGITPKSYKDYFGYEPTSEDMKELTKEEAKEIYNKNYIKKPKFDLIEDDKLRSALIDFGINSGTNRAIRHLQSIVRTKENNIKVDGIIGKETLEAVKNYKGEDLYNKLMNSRINYIKSLKNSKNKDTKKAALEYENGWLDRVKKLDEYLNKIDLAKLV